MRPANQADEFLHPPQDRRLWNESYYLQFNADNIAGYTRLGFQPFEDRANLWLYLINDDRTFWYREEDLDLANCSGLHADADELSLSHQIEIPNREWTIKAEGQCGYTDEVTRLFSNEPSGVLHIELELKFMSLDHIAYQEDRGYDAHSHNKEHYTQPGTVQGVVSLGDNDWSIDALGFRDHSWGGLRDWTPSSGGYYWFALVFRTGDIFKIAAGVRPDGTITDSFHGYHTNGDNIRLPEDIKVEYSDKGGPEQRLRRWLSGDFADEITIEFDFKDGTERLTLNPSGYTPLGYEDRNWLATDLDTPWLTSVINRLPVRCLWENHEGYGWYETMHPRVRDDG